MIGIIARVLILVLAVLVQLGFYWKAFGLWPISWFWFITLTVCSIVLMVLYHLIEELEQG